MTKTETDTGPFTKGPVSVVPYHIPYPCELYISNMVEADSSPSGPQVCKDVRSDVESSSEEEEEKAGAPTKALGNSTYVPKGENGTNGHCAAAARARPHNHHSGW